MRGYLGTVNFNNGDNRSWPILSTLVLFVLEGWSELQSNLMTASHRQGFGPSVSGLLSSF